MFCEKCGSKIPNGARFCEKCGASVEPELKEYKENTHHKKWILGGIAGGAAVVAVVVVSLFAMGVFGGKEETAQTSISMQSDAGRGISDTTAQPTEQPAEQAIEQSTEQPAAAPVTTPDPTPEPTEVSAESNESNEVTGGKSKARDKAKTKTKIINVETEVKRIRKLYNTTQNNLDSYMSGSELEGSDYYYEGGYPVKISIKGGYNDWNYSREYFYHNKKLYFAFVYDGREEHRLYFKDGVLIRYIDEKKNTYDYGNKKLASFSEWKDKVQSESDEIYPDMLNCGN